MRKATLNKALNKAVYKGFTDLLALFGDGEGWTKNVYARKHRRGEACEADDPKATCWCLSGGLDKLNPGVLVRKTMRNYLNEALPKEFRERGLGGFVSFNDYRNTKFPDIRRLVRRARRLVPRVAAVLMLALLAGCGTQICDCGDGRKITREYTNGFDTQGCTLFCATAKCSTTTTTTLQGLVLQGSPFVYGYSGELKLDPNDSTLTD